MSGRDRVPPSEAPTIQPRSDEQPWAAHMSTAPAGAYATAPGAHASMETTGHPSPYAAWLQPGAVVAGTFRIEHELGSGAMGVVVLATHLALDRLVALKVHRASHASDVARLAREAKAMAKVRHPNVVGIYDVREAEGSLFIAMEYVEGQSGRRWLAQQGIGWRQRLDVCLQAAAGLQAAHAAGLVHRDFKPENIMIGSDGRVLVADFGLARAPGAVPIDPATPSPGIDAQLTAEGQVTGTPAYMSPEQWSGGAVDARSDVFALSVVVYESLYGRRPFRGSTAGELAHSISRGLVLDPPNDTQVPRAVFDAIRRGLAVDPNQRHASVAALVRGVEAATSTAGRTGVVLAIGLLALVFGGIGVGVWALGRGDEDPGVVLIEAGDEESEPEPEVAPVIDVRREPTPAIRPRPVSPTPRDLGPTAERPSGEPSRPEELEIPGEAEIEAAQAKFEEINEKRKHGLVTDAQFREAQRELTEIMIRSRDKSYDRTPWDGKSTLVCDVGDRIEVRDVQAKLDTVAIKVSPFCGLKLVNVTIEAPVAIEGHAADRLIIEGGRFDVSRTGIELQVDMVDIDGLEIVGDPLVGAAFGMGTRGTISNSRLKGLTALRVGMTSELEVRGGSLSGKVAVEAQMRARVRTKGTNIDGRIKRAMKSRVERE